MTIRNYLIKKKIKKLSNLCIDLFTIGEFGNSGEVCKEILNLQETLHGDNATDLLPTIVRLSEILIASGNIIDAKFNLDKSLKIALNHKDWIFVDKSLFRLFLISKDEGDFDRAEYLAKLRLKYAEQSSVKNLIEGAKRDMDHIRPH